MKLKIFYKSKEILIFGIRILNSNSDELYKFFDKISYSTIRHKKFSTHFKSFDKVEKSILINNLNNFFSTKEFINLCNSLYNKANKSNSIFLKESFITKLIKKIFGKKFIIFNYRIEFSQMIKNSFILPHTDSPRKLVSLMLYLPNKKQRKIKNISGTEFYEVTNPESKYYSNFSNEQVGFKELKTFYKNSKKIYVLPFDHKYIYGFIKTSKSWHEVKKLNKLRSKEFRRSININLMRS